MSKYHTQVQNLHYNAANGTFDALVVLHEGPDTLKFPCSIARPIDAPFDQIASALVTQAKTARNRGAQALVARTKAVAPRQTGAHVASLARNLLDKIKLPGPAHAA